MHDMQLNCQGITNSILEHGHASRSRYGNFVPYINLNYSLVQWEDGIIVIVQLQISCFLWNWV